MMKIFASFSHSAKLGSLLLLGASVSASAAPIKLAGLGLVDEHLAAAGAKGAAIWRASTNEGSGIFVVRAENWKRPAGKSCSVYLKGIRSVPDGAVIPHSLETMHRMMPMNQLPDLPPWEPFSADDRKAIEECDDFPCLIKLTQRENRDLHQTREALRKKMWQSQVMARCDRYRKIGIPEGYEAAGFPVEPWSRLEKLGMTPTLPRGTDVELLMRMLKSGDGRVRPVRQVIDRRHSIGATQSVMWARAVYSDHYLDSWGEVLILDCPSETGPLRLVHGLWVDLDLLKGGGIFARLTRWKARNAFIELGERYLNSVAEYVHERK